MNKEDNRITEISQKWIFIMESAININFEYANKIFYQAPDNHTKLT